VWLLLIECVFGTVSYHQTPAQQKMIQELRDDEVIAQISSTESERATAAVEEIVKRGARMIPLLMRKKGDKNYFWGYLATAENSATAISVPSGDRRRDKSFLKEGKFVTVEVAALYLITAIYWDSLNIAQGPYLTDLSQPEIKRREANTEKLIKRGWKSVEHWVVELNKQGMAGLRAKKHAPLDDANIRFW